MSVRHEIARLDDLIVTTIDSVRGYEFSARHAVASVIAALFAEMAADRRAIVAALQARSRAIGGTPNDFGSEEAGRHRAPGVLRYVLDGGDAAIIEEIEQGEDHLKHEYDRASRDRRMSLETLGLVRDCYQSILLGQDRASRVKLALEVAD